MVGGATAGCSDRAARVIGQLTDSVYLVTSPEAAELTKLYENIFRAVTLALANEFADACGTLGLDPIEVTLAAATKPYGFLGAFPGPGVGGHCIPCDPHYLLWQARGHNRPTPLIEQAMASTHARPAQVVECAAEVLAADGRSLTSARMVVAGASFHDPLVLVIHTPHQRLMRSIAPPSGAEWDLAVIHVLHPGADNGWLGDCPRILDATYQFDGLTQRSVV